MIYYIYNFTIEFYYQMILHIHTFFFSFLDDDDNLRVFITAFSVLDSLESTDLFLSFIVDFFLIKNQTVRCAGCSMFFYRGIYIKLIDFKTILCVSSSSTQPVGRSFVRSRHFKKKKTTFIVQAGGGRQQTSMRHDLVIHSRHPQWFVYLFGDKQASSLE